MTNKNPNIVDLIIKLETEGLPKDDHLALFQNLVDSGDAWTLQGSTGRQAMELIEAGQIALGPKGHRDYYGNYVPSRTEVKAGTKGSIEFVRQNGGRIPQ